ncbi:MAG TPA: bacteriohemerythrin [Bacteroidales bacterium]|jgi:hemerythrin-like metal-binding protein|nr:bacteriohemerythrin [Bacteroidales bacterium]
MADKAVFFKWTDQMSVNSSEIDDQHKRLVGFLNDMYQAFLDRQHIEKVGPIIDEMAAYAKYHFGTEEKYFATFRFEGSAEHILEHLDFRHKVEEFISKFKKNNSALTYEVMNFLRNWLNNHIMVTDRKYIECFKTNGVR